MIDDLLEEGKTTGTVQTEDLVSYSRLNVQRMKRLDKQVMLYPQLAEAFKSVSNKWIWLVLTEGWCGDAAQNIPTIVKIASLNPNIELKFLLRDENLEIMDNYLTNGGRSIPKLICMQARYPR